MQQARECLDSSIRHFLRHDQVARLGDSREHDGSPMLCSAGNHDPFRIDFEPASTHPPRAGGAMARHPGCRLVVVHQPIQVGSLRDHLQRTPERGLAGISDQPSLAEVEQGRVISLVVGPLAHARLSTPDKGSATHLAAQEAAALRQRVGLADGPDGESQPVGQLSLSREPSSRWQQAALNVAVERIQ